MSDEYPSPTIAMMAVVVAILAITTTAIIVGSLTKPERTLPILSSQCMRVLTATSPNAELFAELCMPDLIEHSRAALDVTADTSTVNTNLTLSGGVYFIEAADAPRLKFLADRALISNNLFVGLCRDPSGSMPFMDTQGFTSTFPDTETPHSQ